MFYNICKMYVNGIIRHKILGSTPTSGTTSFSFLNSLCLMKSDDSFSLKSHHCLQQEKKIK